MGTHDRLRPAGGSASRRDDAAGADEQVVAAPLRNAGLDVRLEALSARRIAVSFNFVGRRDSGISRIRSLKAAGVSPSLWVIELGSNDLGVIQNCECADPVAFAGTIIDQLLDEIGPGVPIAWVTVLSRNQLDASRWFNTAIGIRAARDPLVLVPQPPPASVPPDSGARSPRMVAAPSECEHFRSPVAYRAVTLRQWRPYDF